MPPDVPVNSTSTDAVPAWRAVAGAVGASARARFVERIQIGGWGGYLLIMLLSPVFELTIISLIYRDRPDLLSYAVVGIAAQMFIFSGIYYLGEILDRERISGTLPALFLAPCPRLAWLTGFALVGLVEILLAATVALLFGRLGLGVAFDPDLPALLLTLLLFLAALWGLGFAFSAVGLVLKKANAFSNLVSPVIILLAGIYYPVALLPDFLRYPAMALPYGYATQALASAMLDHAGVADLLPLLLPLAGFAVALPVAGAVAFRWLDRLVRQRGELDLY
jgi:ABC-2 type transport system permease protein